MTAPFVPQAVGPVRRRARRPRTRWTTCERRKQPVENPPQRFGRPKCLRERSLLPEAGATATAAMRPSRSAPAVSGVEFVGSGSPTRNGGRWTSASGARRPPEPPGHPKPVAGTSV